MPDVSSRSSPEPEVVVDLRHLAASLGSVRVALDALAVELQIACDAALAEGDFARIDQIVDASHSVHRAAVALSDETVGSGSPAGSPAWR